MRNPQTMNLYIYCLNNPVRYVDPLGFNGDEDEEEKAKKIVQEIFNYLNNLGLDTMELSLEEYFGELDIVEGMIKLLNDLNFDIEGITKATEVMTLSDYEEHEVTKLMFTIKFGDTEVDIVLYNDENLEHYGYAPPETNEIVLNVNKHHTVGELAATMCHELCHRVFTKEMPELKVEAQHAYIFPVQVAYIDTFTAKSKGRPRVHDIRCPFTDDYINDQNENEEL
jgi:hypothetical protein